MTSLQDAAVSGPENLGAEQVKTRILLVDDRPDNLLALAAVLEPLGFELVTAASGVEALRHLLVEDFALIVLDVQMPGLNGYETAELIKARERTRDIPIMFLTAINSDLEHHLLGYRSGAIDYLAKPFEPEVLRAKVAVLAELWRRGRVIRDQKAALAEQLAELDRVHGALERQAVELERSNAALERFAEVASHQFREPLLTTAGLVELLRAVEGLPDEADLLAERVGGRIAHLNGHVSMLLDYARASSEAFNREAIDLAQVATGAWADLAQAVTATGAQLAISPDLPLVEGDRRLLTWMFCNLFENSLRYRSPDAPRVSVSATPVSDGVEVAVEDNGVGMGAADVARLFTILWHPRNDHRAGVGLAICRRIVERHGGRIWVATRDSNDTGTSIHLVLPSP